MKIKENVELNYMPEIVFENEQQNTKILKIGGTALVTGESQNKNVYTTENLVENDGKNFKFLVGHPTKFIEDHVVGKGSLKVIDGTLRYEGVLMNTARHPDVIDKVKAGLLGPSIHAVAEKITQKEGKYHIAGLNVRGMGLVAFQGVKSASIDYAIAESFQGVEEQDEIDIKTTKGEQVMAEEQEKVAAPQEAVAPVPQNDDLAPPREALIEQVKLDELKAVKEELEALKAEKKNAIVESILEVNKNLKKEELVKESDEKLKLILEYEKKLASKVNEVAVVETNESETKTESVIIESDGAFRLSDAAYAKFNDEMRKLI